MGKPLYFFLGYYIAYWSQSPCSYFSNSLCLGGFIVILASYLSGKLSFFKSNILIERWTWCHWQPCGSYHCDLITQVPYHQQLPLFPFQNSCPWNVHQVPVSSWAEQRWLTYPALRRSSQLSQPCLTSWVIPQAPFIHCDLPEFCPSSLTTLPMLTHRGMMTRVNFHWHSKNIVLKPPSLRRKSKAVYSYDGGYALGIQKTLMLAFVPVQQVQSWLALWRRIVKGKMVRKYLAGTR